MRVYVAGPITGYETTDADPYSERKAVFYAAAQRLREEGHDPVVPFDLHPTPIDRASALRADIAGLITCEAIYLLPGWERSPGATLELSIAQALGLAIMTDERAAPVAQSIRRFATGATRGAVRNKPQYEGYLSPLAIARYGEYMLKHQTQPDGTIRAPDNWQRGIPLEAYMDSGWRHFLDWWLAHRGFASNETLEDALCGVIFNVCGYLHETLKTRGYRQRSEAS